MGREIAPLTMKGDGLMDKLRLFLDGVIAAGAGLFAFMYGDITPLFYAVLSFMVLDYITGVIVAIINKKLSSEIGFKGLAKKFLILIFIALAHILDVNVLNTYPVLQSAVMMFFIANEGISLIENAAKLGLPIPGKLLDVLKQLKKQGENETEQDKEDKTEGDDK